MRRKTGRTNTASLNAVLEAKATLSATSMVWSPIQPGDDIAVQVDKLARNLEAVRDNAREVDAQDRERARAAEAEIRRQLTALEQRIHERDQQDREVTTSAMRWEVRGLFVALVGTAVSLMG